MLLLALAALLSVISIASRVDDCASLVDKIKSDTVHVMATQYLHKESTINHIGEGLDVTCQMNPAPPMPVGICRAILQITTSSLSSVIAEAWLPDESGGRLLSVGNMINDGCW